MPNPDDERFEVYLKQFRPIVAEPLAAARNRRPTRRMFVFAAGVAAAIALLVIATLIVHPHRERAPALQGVAYVETVERSDYQQPLTIGGANELLAHAPSFGAALNRMAFQSRATHLPSGTQSALAVLSKENIK